MDMDLATAPAYTFEETNVLLGQFDAYASQLLDTLRSSR